MSLNEIDDCSDSCSCCVVRLVVVLQPLALSLLAAGAFIFVLLSLSLDLPPNLQLTQRFVPCLGAEQLLGLP
jgi:hypothetical protein